MKELSEHEQQDMGQESEVRTPSWSVAALLALTLYALTCPAATLVTSSLDGGGQRTTSASYAMDGSIGGIVGSSGVASPAIGMRYGWVGQLDEHDNSFVTISTNSAAYGVRGGSGSVGVTTCGSCGWTALSNDGWISVTSGSSGIGNGAVSHSVGSNTSNCVARTGTITIGGQAFTITQAAGAGSYSIAPTSGFHSAMAESGSFTVTASVG
jgi:hypothetical protein